MCKSGYSGIYGVWRSSTCLVYVCVCLKNKTSTQALDRKMRVEGRIKLIIVKSQRCRVS